MGEGDPYYATGAAGSGGLIYYVLLKLHYHPINHWPFFMK